jgi:hypothetical protein
MASPEKFAGDLRSAITDLTASYQRVQALCQFYQAMGWKEADLFGKTGADITAADLIEAMDTVNKLTQTFSAASDSLALSRMKA